MNGTGRNSTVPAGDVNNTQRQKMRHPRAKPVS
ncbi:hypothetical protein FHR83_003938 [Actinoplanes campanulatus]|uniref:Uncharacterized protein n=1 Tax=Actinoplanes campanulatus TaxID=113559 RepID=A0A7W5AH84_9ACTN|nr:hypothetical protein [Actinoplanes campanulatus]